MCLGCATNWDVLLLATLRYSFFSILGLNAAGKGINYAYQGVEPANGLPEEDYIRHAYYQWVPFVLFLQGTYDKLFIVYVFL